MDYPKPFAHICTKSMWHGDLQVSWCGLAQHGAEVVVKILKEEDNFANVYLFW